MEIIKPKKLKKGDTIGILAVSGKIKDIEKINNAKNFFISSGYNVTVSETCFSSHRYMAGSCDKDCVDELHNFFLNKNINAILCARGGYGTLRLINKIDWNIIRNNPKIFAGYSDITILLAMMYKKSNLITFHAPMANGDFGSAINEYTKKSLINTLEGNTEFIEARYPDVYNSGAANGVLWGGNLSSLVSLCGSDFVPDENIILFLEDLNEPSYKIDKMLTQLFNTEKIRQNVRGIALGEFTNIKDDYDLKNIFSEMAHELKIPVSGGFKITHEKTKDTVPYGVKVLFDSNQGRITILDKYLTD